MNEQVDRDERVRRLMMAALDDELDAADEREELEDHLGSDAALRAEWNRLRRLKEVMVEMRVRQPPREVWDTYWTGVYRRMERGLAWILISIGAAVLLGYGIWQAIESVLRDAAIPLVVKGGILALIVGALILLISVVRERVIIGRTDPYKDVRR